VINIATVHWKSAKWIEPQLQFLDRSLDVPYRIFASVNGIPDALDDDRFHFAADLQGSHPEKLNELAALIGEQSDPTDVLMFVDGDAFPVRPIAPWIDDLLAAHPLAAVRRDENLGDPQPHPCFCVTTSGFWAEIGGDWRAGGTWVNNVGKTVTDVGGALLDRLRAHDTPWLPLLRTNTANPHPLLFGVYGHRVYHHGAGFRSVPTRVDLHRQAAYWPSKKRPTVGTLRTMVAAEPSRLLHLRPRHAAVAVQALRRTVVLRHEAAHIRSVNHMDDEMFAQLVDDPLFYRQLDDSDE
jgi:hypothetical protein